MRTEERETDLAAFALTQLRRLGVALGQSSGAEQFEALALVASTWIDHASNGAPRWSAIGDDYSPYEFSVAFKRSGPELRVLAESQAEPATISTYWNAACAFNRLLAERYGVPLQNFDAMASFFEPDGAPAAWVLWHALRFGRREVPDVRLYLNPAVKRNVETEGLAVAALATIGLSGVLEAIARVLDGQTSVALVALDLEREARAKVYFSHHETTVARLVQIACDLDDPVADDIAGFYELLLGGVKRFVGVPVRSCFSVRAKDGVRPTQWNVSAPGEYFGNDGRARASVTKLLRHYRLDVDAYERCLEALDISSITKGLVHTGITIQREEHEPRVTVYFSPLAHARFGRSTPDRADAWAKWCSAIPAPSANSRIRERTA